MARKTFSVEAFKQHVNNVLANSVSDYQQGRTAVALTLEKVLMETGNYKGYGYLSSEYLPADEQTDGNVLRPDYDSTRRHYY